MKSFILALVITVAMVGGSMLYTRELDSISEEALGYNTRIQATIAEDDFDGAKESVNALEQYVTEKRIPLSMILDHTTLDKIESSIAELSGFVAGEMKTDALAQNNVLEVLFRHLPQNYKVRLENIL